nr:MAG TPA: hypothetical protein [Caudoviricetes sp.]
MKILYRNEIYLLYCTSVLLYKTKFTECSISPTAAPATPGQEQQ